MLGRMTVSVKFTRKNLDICLSLTLSVSSILAVPSTMVCTLRHCDRSPVATAACPAPCASEMSGEKSPHTRTTRCTQVTSARARARVPCLLSPPQPQPPPWRVIFFLHAFPVAFVNVFLNFFFLYFTNPQHSLWEIQYDVIVEQENDEYSKIHVR